MSANNSTLSVTPLGAGDLIDRAVRFYRAHFRVFIFMAAPPVIVGTLVSVAWRMAGREIFFAGTRIESYDTVFYYIYLWLGGLAIWFTEIVATLVVMGGASRNFVRHLLFDEPISFLATYRDVRKRLGGLVVASSIMTILLGIVGVVVFYFGLFIAAMGIALVIWALVKGIPTVLETVKEILLALTETFKAAVAEMLKSNKEEAAACRADRSARRSR